MVQSVFIKQITTCIQIVVIILSIHNDYNNGCQICMIVFNQHIKTLEMSVPNWKISCWLISPKPQNIWQNSPEWDWATWHFLHLECKRVRGKSKQKINSHILVSFWPPLNKRRTYEDKRLYTHRQQILLSIKLRTFLTYFKHVMMKFALFFHLNIIIVRISMITNQSLLKRKIRFSPMMIKCLPTT